LDPYGLNLNWNVISTAGKMRTLDIFINFPVEGMNRNVLWRDPERVAKSSIERMNAFWGDESWRNIAYGTSGNLFGFPENDRSCPNRQKK
jgi:three-Cys-motif partner protein